MKTLTLLKITTFVLALALAAGLFFMAYKITGFEPKSKPQTLIQSEFVLNFPETINTITTCGEKLCLMTVGHENGRRLLIVDPKSGKISSIITFKDRM
ncbi:MAG: hypothetical protein IKS41_00680 [Alphaproteobacteria bacterium]|nr:hypothetical protein [Alphaproteobacteria bacterium]